MSDRVKINIIYAPQIGQATSPRFQNEQGEVWMNPIHMNNMHNISMGFYSANYPNPIKVGDSFYAVEPMCVSERDYEIDFVNRFKYIFTWADKAFKNTPVEKKVIPINHPSCNGVNEDEYENRKSIWKPWNERKEEIVVIANNKSSGHFSELYSLRTRLSDWINNDPNKFNISWYGQSHLPRGYYKGKIETDKSSVLTQVRFSICSENCYDKVFSNNYLTEKLPEVWFSGVVPLYIGCYNIDDFGFHPDSYIDLRKYVDVKARTVKKLELLDYLNSYNEESYNKYLKALEYNIYKAKLFNVISDERVMIKMIETFWKEKNGI